jgi:protein gp37
MADKSKIEWTQSDDGTPGATWNPVTGCTKISPGCDHCYAETFAERWRGIPGHHFENGFVVTLRPDRLEQPIRWKRPRRIFVNSMSDLFHQAVPDRFIARVFAVMATARQHTYLVLTKRHGRMRSLLNSNEFRLTVMGLAAERDEFRRSPILPLSNVWLGVSVESQKWAAIRIPALMATPAKVRFVSCEPLLEQVDLALDHECGDPPHWTCPVPDWVIIGGESGPGARPMELEWARDLVRQCHGVGAAPFVKQIGSVLGRQLGAGPKGGDWSAWPEDLRVREFPYTAGAVRA